MTSHSETVPCHDCRGWGKDPATGEKCETCKGDGEIDVQIWSSEELLEIDEEVTK